MKIGMNMLLWTNHVTEAHLPILENIKEVGYDGIEIPLGEGDVKHYTHLSKQISDLGLQTTCVTSLLEDSNIASPNANIRKAGLAHIKWAIETAATLNAGVVTGPFHSAFAYFTGVPPTHDEKKWSIENLQMAGEYAAQFDIQLAPEALNRFECYLINTMSDMKAHLDQVNHPNVGSIFDTHHANIEEKSQREAILTIEPYLKHVHISENDRGTPGKGQINWEEVFSTLKEINYDGWITIEAFSRAIPEFSNAINVWREFSLDDEICQEGYTMVKHHIN
jgi:D-psicose/D-tagatose/L-ribulose 3-epimerase